MAINDNHTATKDDVSEHLHLEKSNGLEGQTLVPSEELMADPAWRKAEKRLVRKLDMTLLPVVWVLYMFNYLDRNNIAYAISP